LPSPTSGSGRAIALASLASDIARSVNAYRRARPNTACSRRPSSRAGRASSARESTRTLMSSEHSGYEPAHARVCASIADEVRRRIEQASWSADRRVATQTRVRGRIVVGVVSLWSGAGWSKSELALTLTCDPSPLPTGESTCHNGPMAFAHTHGSGSPGVQERDHGPLARPLEKAVLQEKSPDVRDSCPLGAAMDSSA
jgi:hypothetical protein